MENNNNKLLQALRNSGADKIFEAFKWVLDHRNEFKKEVNGPVLLEVSVKNRVHAGYLGDHVAGYICRKMWALLDLHARGCNESECTMPRGRNVSLVLLLLVFLSSKDYFIILKYVGEMKEVRRKRMLDDSDQHIVAELN